MSFINVNNENIFFSFNDSEKDHNLLLVHGSGGDHTHWPEKLRMLPDLCVYAPDLPGHGKSLGAGRERVEAYADFIGDFVSELNLSNVILAGHSLGGAIVQSVALRFPVWLNRIILVGTGARLRVTPTILDRLLSDFERAVEVICEYAYGPDAPESMIHAGREGFLRTDPRVIHGDYNACNQFDIMDQVKNITIPTLIISGSEDRLTPVKYSRYLHEQIQDSRLSVIRRAGHMMALEKPEEFIRLIL